jgi:hypothetical protein
MLPVRIDKRIFQKLESSMSDDERTLINQEYRLDENPLEPVFVLRPVDPAKTKEWEVKKEQLQMMLRRASDFCLQKKMITESERDEFHISGELFMYSFLIHTETSLVTAKEIYRALKLNENCPQRMIVFFREIEDIDGIDPKIKKKFIDSSDETKTLLNDTKTIIRHALSPENIYTYSVCTKAG